ncbi:hypothetical protein PENSPDRAFT_739992 [Peniophora sp. CONT]|nr:hypothetical protein PENSPDRAFT_739992 [Peniophora sp. CONT]
MRAPDAAKYAKRFSDSHQRLNTYIGLLSHQSTSQLLGEHCHYALQITRESRALRQSAEDIKALALSALQQVSIQSRQQVVEQALSLPFFAPPRDRRVASRVQRAMDMIFDSLAPHTPAAQRERFLSLLAPFLVVGAAFVVHNNMFHSFLDLLCSDYNEDARNFVRLRLYELYLGGTSEIIPVNNWSSRILPGTCLEMGIVVVPYANSVATCHEVICAACSSQFRQTTEPWTITKWVGSFAGAAELHRRSSTDIRVELFQMNVPLDSSLSMAQYNQGSSALPDGVGWRRCSRVHVVKLLVKSSDAPEDIQSSSKMFMNILLSDETSDPRRGHKLLRSYMDLIEDLGRLEPALRDLGDMHTSKSSCGNARQNVQGIRGYGPGLRGPMTVEEQLLGHMVASAASNYGLRSKTGHFGSRTDLP